MTPLVADFSTVKEMFLRDVSEHEMTVLHDDGLYRHIRFQKKDAPFFWFDLITWPGSLVIHGDMGSWQFARTSDMFEFFKGSDINPGYWAEKLQGEARKGARTYSEKVMAERVDEWVAEVSEDRELSEELRTRLAAEVRFSITGNEEASASEDLVRAAIYDFEFTEPEFSRSPDIRISMGDWDWWDIDFSDWDYGFLWNCHAIQYGIARYRERHPV